MSPFRSENATLEEHQRRLADTIGALESEAAGLASAHARVRRISCFDVVVALGIIGGGALIGGQVGAVATAVLTAGVDARTAVAQRQELQDEAAQTDQCLVLREQERRSLLAGLGAVAARRRRR